MHESGVIGLPEKVEQMERRIHIGRKGVAQIRIKVREAGTVHDKVERFREPRLRGFIETEARQAHVAFDDFYFFPEKCAEFSAVSLVQRVKCGRLFHNFLEAALRRSGTVAANQERDLADVRNIFKQVYQPDLADEPSCSNEQEVSVRQRFADQKALHLRCIPESSNGLGFGRNRTSRGLHGVIKLLRLLRPAELAEQSLARNTSVSGAARNPGERPARANDGIHQSSGGLAVSKFQAVGNERVDPKMIGQRAKNAFKELPDKNDSLTAANRFDQFLDGLAAQLRLQNVEEVFLAEEIQSIAADAAEQGVQKARGKRAVGGVRERPRERHPGHAQAARPAL